MFGADKTASDWKMLPSRTLRAGDKSTPGFEAWADSPFRGDAAADSKLKPTHMYHSETPRALVNCASSALPVLSKRNSKAWMMANLFTTWLTEYCKPAVETYCSGEKDFFQNITAH